MVLHILFLIAGFVITWILGKFTIPVLKRLKASQTERRDGPRSHLRKQGTPTMGGVMTIMSIIILVAVVAIIKEDARKEILAVGLASLGFGLIGFIDDYKKVILRNPDGLSPILKLLGQAIVSVLFIVFILKGTNLGTDMKIPFVNNTVTLPTWFYIIFMIFVMLGTTNAINLTDGVDGLAGSVTEFIVLALAIIAYKWEMFGVSLFGYIAFGCIQGFLIYNYHKAKVIMGDTGSLLLGGIVSSMAIYMQNPLVLIIIAIIPIVETISVILQVLSGRFRGVLIFRMAPLHHHLELTGWRENKVVLVFTTITIIASLIGIIASLL